MKQLGLGATLILALALVSVPVCGQSFSTWEGPTGLYNTPTAELAPAEQSVVDLLYANYDDLDLKVSPGLHYRWGAAKLEAGVGLLSLKDGASESGFVLHGKFQFLPETQVTPAVAAGLHFWDLSDTGSLWRLYAAASKRLTVPATNGGALHGHLNLGYSSADWEAGPSEEDLVVALGVEYRQPLRQERCLSVFADLELDNDVAGESSFAGGVRYQFSPQLGAQLGVGDDGLLFVGVNYGLVRPKR